MIKLNLHEYCQECPEYEPLVDKCEHRSCDGTVRVTTTVSCEHYERCGQIIRFLERQKGEKHE